MLAGPSVEWARAAQHSVAQHSVAAPQACPNALAFKAMNATVMRQHSAPQLPGTC